VLFPLTVAGTAKRKRFGIEIQWYRIKIGIGTEIRSWN